MLSKLLVLLVCILAVSSEARLHGRRRLSRSGHKIRRLMNQASPRCNAILMDGCQHQCAVFGGNSQQCTTCNKDNLRNNYDELLRHGCVEPPKLDKCAAIKMDGCVGLCYSNAPECSKCMTRNMWNNWDELVKNGCTNRNRRLNAGPTSWQQARRFQSWNNWDEAEENVGGGRVYGEYNKGPYKAGAEYNWDEEEENVGGRGYGKPQFREYFEAGGWRL